MRLEDGEMREDFDKRHGVFTYSLLIAAAWNSVLQ